MPKLLTAAEIDPAVEQIDNDLIEAGENVALPQHKYDPNAPVGDLSDGGMVGGVRVTPVGASGQVSFDKKRREPGRPNGRQVWSWDGRESVIPLAWDTAGKTHDGGRKYLLKRWCPACNYSGFYGQVCPDCRKAGRRLVPVLPAYYTKKERVPKPLRFFGKVDCFVPTCVRHGEYGFLDDAQMRQHAMSRHRNEYRAFMDATESRNKTDMASMQQQINTLIASALGARAQQEPAPRPDRMAKARAAKAAKEAQAKEPATMENAVQ